MIKRKDRIVPFGDVKIEKKAYDLSNIRKEDIRKEIKNYLITIFPFLSQGLEYVNFKVPPTESGDAVGYIKYNDGTKEFVIPLIIEENNLKEPNIAIYNNKAIPIDKEYMEYMLDSHSPEAMVNDNELPGNMQYITQSGLFQPEDGGQYKRASRIYGISVEEDINNPYHYIGALLKKAEHGQIYTEDGVMLTASEMLMAVKEAEDNRTNAGMSFIGQDKEVVDLPQVQKITESGKYQSVMIGRRVMDGAVYTDLLNLSGGRIKKSLFIQLLNAKQSPSLEVQRVGGSRNIEDNSWWGYGDAHGSGYYGDVERWDISDRMKPLTDIERESVAFVQKKAEKKEDGKEEMDYDLTVPCYIETIENIMRGEDGGERVMIIHARSYEDNAMYRLIVTNKINEGRIVKQEKLKNTVFGYLEDPASKVLLIPETWQALVLPSVKKPLDGLEEGADKIAQQISDRYPNRMNIINRGNGIYNITVSDKENVIKHGDMSKNAALLVANYYTGQESADISEYVCDHNYAFSGTIKTASPTCMKYPRIFKYRGHYNEMAKELNNDPFMKSAGIEESIDKMVGVDTAIDDEKIETTNVLQLLDDVISRISELLMMARLGKSQISESILNRALYANVKMSNEIRGLSSSYAS